MNILIAHELGNGRDGQVRILAISKLIKANFPDSKIVLTIKNAPENRYYNSRFIDKIVNCPTDLFQVHKDSTMHKYVLDTYLGSPDLTGLYRKSWDSLFLDVRPDVVIADNAPSAVIMANISRIPVMQVSDGFHHLQTTDVHDQDLQEISKRLKYDVCENKFLESKTLIVNSPVFVNEEKEGTHFVHLDAEKDDDGGLPIDIFAYIRKSDPMSQHIVSALDQINHDFNKSVLVVMGGIEPILYKQNFELTPYFVRLQGALYGSPVVIQSFGTGLLLESIKNQCPIWGIPHTKDQIKMRSILKAHYQDRVSPQSRDDIYQSLLTTVLNKEKLSENSKKIWGASVKMGISPISQRFTEVFGGLI